MRVTLRQLGMGAVLLLWGGAQLTQAQTGGSAAEPPVAPPAMVDRVYFNQDLFVPKGQILHNATCVFCSVQVEGDATGRVLVLFGNLSVSGEIRGTTTVVGGNAVYETDEVLTGSAYVLGGHSSSYAARKSLRRRLALGPKLVSTLALLGFLLLLLLAYGVRQRRYAVCEQG